MAMCTDTKSWNLTLLKSGFLFSYKWKRCILKLQHLFLDGIRKSAQTEQQTEYGVHGISRVFPMIIAMEAFVYLDCELAQSSSGRIYKYPNALYQDPNAFCYSDILFHHNSLSFYHFAPYVSKIHPRIIRKIGKTSPTLPPKQMARWCHISSQRQLHC